MNRPPLSAVQIEVIESVAAAALEVDETERRELIQRLCDGDASVELEVEELLQSHARIGSFLESGAEIPPVEREGEQTAEAASFGPYTLIERIGEGGFGEVWLAEQTQPVHRRVALKLIKPGMDTRAVLSRFEVERQALALMDHPCVAAILDAGTTPAGRPFFVMQHVIGEPITRYCDANRISIPDRLDLFVRVCEVVQHAHQKGVIHRDLKPSNILVEQRGGRPIPRIIDFGIAKALHQPLAGATTRTEAGQLIGTPEYMSPEQASAGETEIDTRSDIFSLGVLLFELLTALLPFDRSGFYARSRVEALRIIREADPSRPSERLAGLFSRASEPASSDKSVNAPQSLSAIARDRSSTPSALIRTVRGELDWIVLRCLRNDPNARYGTAAELADDVTRYLTGEPVRAAAPSSMYKLRKFVRRHRGRVAAAAVLAIVLVTLTAVATPLAIVSTRALAREQREKRKVEAVNEFLTGMLQAPSPTSNPLGLEHPLDVTILEYLDFVSAGIDDAYAEDAEVRDELRRLLATAYWVADRYDDWATQLEFIASSGDTRRDGSRSVISARLSLANGWNTIGQPQRAIDAIRGTPERAAEDLGQYDELTVGAFSARFRALYLLRRCREAWPDAREAIQRVRGRVPRADRIHIQAIRNVALMELNSGNYDEAIHLLQDNLQAAVSTYGEQSTAANVARTELANGLAAAGRLDEAIPLLEDATEAARAILGPDRFKTTINEFLLARVLLDAGDVSRALRLAADCVVAAETLCKQDDPQLLWRQLLLSECFLASERPDEAAKIATEVREVCLRSRGMDAVLTAEAENLRGRTLIAQGLDAQAESILRNALNRADAWDHEHPRYVQMALDLVGCLERLGRVEEARRLRERIPPDALQRADVRTGRRSGP